MIPQPGAILSVAGSDPSGGAGIQADLKTLTVLGVYGAAAITSLTVQNTLGVQSCQPVAPQLVAQQVKAVLDDLPVTHVKIGMIGSTAVAQSIAQALTDFSGEVILDPIVFTSVGQPVAAIDSLDGVRLLAARAHCLTPNLGELALLSGRPCPTPAEALQAGLGLLASFPNLRALVVKGGHLLEAEPEITDYLLLAGQPHPVPHRHRRLLSANTHGTGCTFASALAAYHQRSGDYQQAFHLAVDFLDTLLTLSEGYHFGRGHGGLCHHCFRDQTNTPPSTEKATPDAPRRP